MAESPPGEGRADAPAGGVEGGRFTRRLQFTMPKCHRHFFKGHKWWCRACDRQTEVEMRDAVHHMWTLQGAGDRIDHD